VILDIGGQDTKAISLNEAGEMSKFEMNDKCAAGTGRFLEIMAAALAIPGGVPEGGVVGGAFREDKQHVHRLRGVGGHLAHGKGGRAPEVALGIHRAIVSRSTTLLKRIAPSGEVFFAGGVALNGCVETLIAEDLGRPVFVPPDPQMVGALGAALHALKSGGREDATP
jgi:activator of 2-hydroxyglutaryl-CoA dehydratase